MPLFWKPHRSDVTRFIAKLRQVRPQLEAEQRAGRALLWDRPIDRDALAEWRDADVPQQPYVYQSAPPAAAPAARVASPASAPAAATAPATATATTPASSAAAPSAATATTAAPATTASTPPAKPAT